MSKIYEYVWKGAIPPFDRSVGFNEELTKDNVFVDLRNGRAYRVVSVDGDAFHAHLMKTLAVEELVSLRQKCGFKQGAGDDEYAILANATC